MNKAPRSKKAQGVEVLLKEVSDTVTSESLFLPQYHSDLNQIRDIGSL